jgi:lipid-A-disaccharide synthase-like uncharacterized protein
MLGLTSPAPGRKDGRKKRQSPPVFRHATANQGRSTCSQVNRAAPDPSSGTEAKDMTSGTIWLGVGFLGQAMFSGRFLVQWLVSEARRESVIPVAFWWFSIAGGMTLLAYAIWRQDPVFITGQAFGLLVYTRNLILIRRKSSTDGDAAAEAVDA